MTHSYRKMLIYRRRRGEALIQTDGWMDGATQAPAPLVGGADQLCSDTLLPSVSVTLPTTPTSLPFCFVLFFPFSTRRLHVFFHPHASLPAACEVKWKGTEAADFKMHIPSGRDGCEAAGGLQSCSDQYCFGSNNVKYDLNNKVNTANLLLVLFPLS